MGLEDERFERAIAAIDAANADDPNRIVVRGVERPKELAHAELMTEWVHKLRPDADEALLLAARAHHIRRWTTPRSDYPDGRGGYLRWRTGLHNMHAEVVGRILTVEGYDAETIARVQDIVRKRNLAGDADVQALEDALCLVFVETQFHDLAARLDEEKMVEVVRKTLAKMSSEGKAFALAMDLPGPDRKLLERAL
ncbi:MAG: DUF4202 domain-containing protein [Actinobacteria bacterium]|nr:DUF4202 domain-containing protein [Actinomycetota bacterium]